MNRFIIFLITLTSKCSYCYDYVCCENSCISSLTDLDFSFDGDCDDGGENSNFSFCDLGLDCSDCGERNCYYSPPVSPPSLPPISPTKIIDYSCQLSNKKAKKCNTNCSKKCMKKNCCYEDLNIECENIKSNKWCSKKIKKCHKKKIYLKCPFTCNMC